MTAGTLIMMGAEELRALLADERRRTVEEVRQIVADRADEELLAPKDAAAAVGMTAGAFRQAMAADAELRRRFVGT